MLDRGAAKNRHQAKARPQPPAKVATEQKRQIEKDLINTNRQPYNSQVQAWDTAGLGVPLGIPPRMIAPTRSGMKKKLVADRRSKNNQTHLYFFFFNYFLFKFKKTPKFKLG